MIIAFHYVIYVYCVSTFSGNFIGGGIGGALVPPIDKPMGLPILECSWTLIVYFLKS